MKRSFFQAAVVSILLYGCTTWTLTKRMEKKLDENYTRMMRAILNKSWRQHPTKHQIYSHRPTIAKTIKVRRTKHAGHCWRSKNEFISDVLLWTPSYGRAKAGRPARTYTQQLCEDTGCSPEDLQEAMKDREEWRETVKDIHAGGTTGWWWWLKIRKTLYKFISKKKNQGDNVRHLILPGWNREKESQTMRLQEVTSSFCQTTICPLILIRGPNCEGTKNLSQQVGFVTRFLNCR